MTNGQMQQLLGELLREKIDPNIWVKIALESPSEKDYLIISDVRYPNECDEILKL